MSVCNLFHLRESWVTQADMKGCIQTCGDLSRNNDSLRSSTEVSSLRDNEETVLGQRRHVKISLDVSAVGKLLGRTRSLLKMCFNTSKVSTLALRCEPGQSGGKRHNSRSRLNVRNCYFAN